MYTKPGVYVEPIVSVAPTTSIGTSCCAFIGITPKGEVGKPVLVTSWSDFINKFATGLETPFMEISSLSYAVYGFFQNGGSKAYILRILGASALEGAVTLKDTTTPTALDLFKLKAKELGVWANSNLKVTITENGVVSKAYDLVITCGTEVLESFGNLSLDKTDSNYFAKVINQKSKVISVDLTAEPNITESTEIKTGTYAFTGGTDDITESTVTDTTYVGALPLLDLVSDVNILCVPNQTSQTIYSAVMSYCENKKSMIAILDLPESATVDSLVTLRPNLASDYAVAYFPRINIADPLSNGALKTICNCGHIAGVYARTDNTRGVFKAPAGVEAIISGAVSLSTQLSTSDMGKLNDLDFNCLAVEKNVGVVVWGARTLSIKNNTYVSDVRLDIFIYESCKQMTQFAVFEPNDEILWSKITTRIMTFLRELWSVGGLKGTTPANAFFVKCDSENNTEASQNAGTVNIEVGYAKKKPAEFVILKFSQKSAE